MILILDATIQVGTDQSVAGLLARWSPVDKCLSQVDAYGKA